MRKVLIFLTSAGGRISEVGGRNRAEEDSEAIHTKKGISGHDWGTEVTEIYLASCLRELARGT